MNADLLHEALDMIEHEARSRPSPMEFELAYQARVAMDRIRFAIRQTEQFGPRTVQTREAGFQLLDALHRLETADRSFQERSRRGSKPPHRRTGDSASLNSNRHGESAATGGHAHVLFGENAGN